MLSGELARPWLGAGPALFVSFLAATAFVLATRSRARDRRVGHSALLLVAGLGAGFASHPVWIALIAATGLDVGLSPAAPPRVIDDPLLWCSVVVLAPVFEELLYRERLLGALRPVLGSAAALVVTSALFAVSHVEPWVVLGTFAAGLALGVTLWASRSVALCIGLHMGLNLAAVG